MFWSMRENLCGITHMRRLATRMLLGRKRSFYIEKLKAAGYAVEPVLNDDGDTLNCRLCGYANISTALSPGYSMTLCSTLGKSVLPFQEKLKVWSSHIPQSSQEACARVSGGQSVGDESIV